MASFDVVNQNNEKAGSVDLAPEIFSAKVRRHLYHAEVLRQLAVRRQGTHSTKNRAGVSGGGAKPYKQKGTGRARQGTTRAPVGRGWCRFWARSQDVWIQASQEDATSGSGERTQ